MEFGERASSVVDPQIDLGQQRLFVSYAFGDDLTQVLESEQPYLTLLAPEVAQDVAVLSQKIKEAKFKGTAVIVGEQELQATAALARLVLSQAIQLVGCDLGKHQIKELITLWRFLERQSGMPERQSAINEARSNVSGRYADRRDILMIIRGLQELPTSEQPLVIKSFDKLPIPVVITINNVKETPIQILIPKPRSILGKILPQREYQLIET